MGLCSSSDGRVMRDNAEADLLSEGRFAVVVDVARARSVKKMDLRSESDAYVVLSCGGLRKRTVTFGNSAEPVWNSSFLFRFKERPQQLTIVAKDEDVLWDDVIGHHTMELGKYFDRAEGQEEWEWVPVTKAKRNGEVELNGQIEIRIKCYNMDDELATRLEHYSFSHLLEVNVLEAKNLPGEFKGDGPAADKPVAYQVATSFGTKEFRTFAVRGQTPKWRQRAFFWANAKTQGGYQVHVSVYNEAALAASLEARRDKKKKKTQRKLADEALVGGTFVAVSDFFQRENQAVEGWYTLSEATVNSDRTLRLADALAKSSRSDNTDDEAQAYVKLSFKMTPKEEVLDGFFNKILRDFDESGDGMMQRNEMRAMFDALGVEVDEDHFEQFWVAVDRDGTGEITSDEAGKLLRTLLFVNQESANRVMTFLSEGVTSLRKTLMQPARLAPRDRGREIPVMERSSGLIAREYIPGYIVVALSAMFDSRSGRAVARLNRTRRVLQRMSVRQGEKFDSPDSARDIAPFVELHRLNLDEVLKPVDEFKTFNEFFYRELKPTARPVHSPSNASVLVSPADCRMMVFPDIHSSFRAWVKGSDFTIEALLGERGAELAPRFRDGALCIARLAPQDYHRYHYAATGKVVRRTPIDGALYTVNPLAVNSSISVYTENKRVVEEIETEEFGLAVAVCIGATMVGSIDFYTKVGDHVRKGDQQGFFAFGGSTVLWLFERGAVQFDGDVLSNSMREQPVETLVRVNTRIGASTAQAAKEKEVYEAVESEAVAAGTVENVDEEKQEESKQE